MRGSSTQYQVRNKRFKGDMAQKRQTMIEKLKLIVALPAVVTNPEVHEKIQKILDAIQSETDRYDYKLMDEEVEVVPLEVWGHLDKRGVGRLSQLMAEPNTRLHHLFGGRMSPLVEALHKGWQEVETPSVTEQQSWSSTIAK